MPTLPKFLSDFQQEIRSNRLLQYGLLAIALLGCVELALGWSDALTAKEKNLQELRSELRTLRTQSRDEDALRGQLAELEGIQKVIDQRLWVVSSDAVGQARLKDWLTTILKKAASKNFNLVLSSPRAMGAREGSTEAEKSSTGAGNKEAKAASGNTALVKDNVKDLRELRANLTLTFTPAALEQILSDIEGGEPLATVESLNVNRRDRKVDMTVRVLMRIGQPDELASLALKDPVANAVQNGSDPTPPATQAQPANGRPISTPPPLATDPGKPNPSVAPPPASGMLGVKP